MRRGAEVAWRGQRSHWSGIGEHLGVNKSKQQWDAELCLLLFSSSCLPSPGTICGHIIHH